MFITYTARFNDWLGRKIKCHQPVLEDLTDEVDYANRVAETPSDCVWLVPGTFDPCTGESTL